MRDTNALDANPGRLLSREDQAALVLAAEDEVPEEDEDAEAEDGGTGGKADDTPTEEDEDAADEGGGITLTDSPSELKDRVMYVGDPLAVPGPPPPPPDDEEEAEATRVDDPPPPPMMMPDPMDPSPPRNPRLECAAGVGDTEGWGVWSQSER
jgi:hypothetical protein